jgi:hypothetical protein
MTMCFGSGNYKWNCVPSDSASERNAKGPFCYRRGLNGSRQEFGKTTPLSLVGDINPV